MKFFLALFAGFVVIASTSALVPQTNPARPDHLHNQLSAPATASRTMLFDAFGHLSAQLEAPVAADADPVPTCEELCVLIDEKEEELAELEASREWAHETWVAVQESCESGVIMHCDEAYQWEALVQGYDQLILGAKRHLAQLYALKAAYC